MFAIEDNVDKTLNSTEPTKLLTKQSSFEQTSEFVVKDKYQLTIIITNLNISWSNQNKVY